MTRSTRLPFTAGLCCIVVAACTSLNVEPTAGDPDPGDMMPLGDMAPGDTAFCTAEACNTPGPCQSLPGTCENGLCSYGEISDSTPCALDANNTANLDGLCAAGVCSGDFTLVLTTSDTFIVPLGVSEIRALTWGGGGGGGSDDVDSTGGAGGYAESVLAVQEGDALEIIVGTAGTTGSWSFGGDCDGAPGMGAYNGGAGGDANAPGLDGDGPLLGGLGGQIPVGANSGPGGDGYYGGGGGGGSSNFDGGGGGGAATVLRRTGEDLLVAGGGGGGSGDGSPGAPGCALPGTDSNGNNAGGGGGSGACVGDITHDGTGPTPWPDTTYNPSGHGVGGQGNAGTDCLDGTGTDGVAVLLFTRTRR